MYELYELRRPQSRLIWSEYNAKGWNIGSKCLYYVVQRTGMIILTPISQSSIGIRI